MPAVTLWLNPYGLPMASTGSPTRTALESPSASTGSGRLGVTFSSAMSVARSAPTTQAGSSRPSNRRMRRSTTPRTTCSLVRMKPSLLMMKPVPIDVRPESPSLSLPPDSASSPRTWTTAARARSARSASPVAP